MKKFVKAWVTPPETYYTCSECDEEEPFCNDCEKEIGEGTVYCSDNEKYSDVMHLCEACYEKGQKKGKK